MRRDLRLLYNTVGPKALVAVIVAAAVAGAVVDVIRSYTRPLAPKGTPPA